MMMHPAIVIATENSTPTEPSFTTHISVLPPASSLFLSPPVPRRLSAPVAAQEATICDVFTRQPAFFSVIGMSKSESSSVGPFGMVSQEKAPLAMRAYELYPMTRELHLSHDIPGDIWDDSIQFDKTMEHWRQLFKGYRGMQTRDKYRSLIDEVESHWDIDGLQLFGRTRNALTPVVQLASILDSPKRAKSLILHSITIVCLQFYMMQRDRFMEVYTDEQDIHLDVHQPVFFLLFPRYDVKKTPYRIPVTIPAEQWVDRFDFVSFLCNVLRRLIPLINQHLPATHELTQGDCTKWCTDKVFNNMGQFFVTSRFLNMRVADYANRIKDSIVNKTHLLQQYNSRPIVTDGCTKFFPAPDFLSLYALHFNNKPPYNNTAAGPDRPNSTKSTKVSNNRLQQYQSRIPVPYTHFFFSPSSPVTTFKSAHILTRIKCRAQRTKVTLDEDCARQDDVLYELAKHMDTTLLERVQSSLKEQFADASAHIKDAKRTTFYPSLALNLVRVRYSFVIREKQLWTNVLMNLHMDGAIHSEASPLFISDQYWEYCEQKAQMVALGETMKHLIVEDSEPVQSVSSPLYPAAWSLGEDKRCIDDSVAYGTYERLCAEHFYAHLPLEQRNSFMSVQAMMVGGMLEEDAIALLIRDGGLTRDRFARDYLQHVDIVRLEMHEYGARCIEFKAPHLKDLMTRSLVKWRADRYMKVPAPSEQDWRKVLVRGTMRLLLLDLTNNIKVKAHATAEPVQDWGVIFRLLELAGVGEREVQLPMRYQSMVIVLDDTRELSWDMFLVYYLEIIQVRLFMLSAYFRLCLPVAVIKCSEDTRWLVLATMRRDHAPAMALLYKMIKAGCGDTMVVALTKMRDHKRSHPGFRPPETITSLYNALFVMLNGVGGLISDKQRHGVVEMLREICQDGSTQHMPFVTASDVNVVTLGARFMDNYISIYGQKEVAGGVMKLMDHLMNMVQNPEDMMAMLVTIFSRVSPVNQPMLKVFERECVDESERRGANQIGWKVRIGKAVRRRRDAMED
jgi:hypothetical protein